MAVADSGAIAPELHDTGRAFEVEQHGIDHIPHSDRRGRPFDLFWIWLGANVIFTYVIDGAIVVGFGLGFWAAITVTVLGNLFYALLGVVSIPGARAGTATLVISRSALGLLGNAPAALLSWLTAIGWEAVNIVIGSLSLYEILQEFGAGSGTTQKAISLVVIIALTFGVAVLGHATITVLNKFFSFALGLGTIVLGIFVMPQTHLNAHPTLTAPTHLGAWLLALAVMMAVPFSWVNTGSDYSRYLPSRTSGSKITLWTALGGFIPAVLITTFGVAAATATDMTDPVAGLKSILPTWFFLTYLAVIVGGTITNNFLNTYSSGMSLLALGLKAKRWQAVIVDATIGTALSAYALFVFDFTSSFTSFLSLMVLWIAPWCGIFLADMILRRAHYDVASLYSAARLGQKRVNAAGLGWFLGGMVLASLFASSAVFQGPLTGLLGGGDISIFVGFGVAFLGYYMTMRTRVKPAPDSAATLSVPETTPPQTSVASRELDEGTVPA